MKATLKQRIENYFKRNPTVWFCGGEIQQIAGSVGFEPSNAARRLRELCAEGRLIRELRKSNKGAKVAWYKLNDQFYKTTSFFVPSENKLVTTVTVK